MLLLKRRYGVSIASAATLCVVATGRLFSIMVAPTTASVCFIPVGADIFCWFWCVMDAVDAFDMQL
jgi:hypothetical protein